MMRLKQLSPDESASLEWWAGLITEAEIVTKNPRAVRNPRGYGHDLALDLWRKEDSLPAIVAEWKQTALERRLNEPLWPGTPRYRIGKVLEAVA